MIKPFTIVDINQNKLLYIKQFMLSVLEKVHNHPNCYTTYVMKWLLEPHARVLNFTHSDLDGVCSGIVVKAMFKMSTMKMINYGKQEADDVEFVKSMPDDTYDIVLFTDFTPHDEMIELLHERGIPFCVIDHHKTAVVHDDDPFAMYIMNYNKCGARLVFNIFKDYYPIRELDKLSYLANDHDLWIHATDESIKLNRLYYLLGIDTFMEHYQSGMARILPEDERLLANYDNEVAAYFATCGKEDLPDSGCMIHCDKYKSDISMILDKTYRWYVMWDDSVGDDGDDSIKLSFRCRIEGIDVGAILKGFNMGGGGHPSAAGQGLPAGSDVKGFILKVHEKMFPPNEIKA